MAATKLQANWAAVSFTPSGGTLTPILKVKSCNIDPGGTLAANSADQDRFPTTILALMSAPKISLVSHDIAGIQAFHPGDVGAFAATYKDAKGASGGDIVYAGVNAVVENNPGGGEHAAYGEGTLSFQLYSSDGTTNPISFTRV